MSNNYKIRTLMTGKKVCAKDVYSAGMLANKKD